MANLFTVVIDCTVNPKNIDLQDIFDTANELSFDWCQDEFQVFVGKDSNGDLAAVAENDGGYFGWQVQEPKYKVFFDEELDRWVAERKAGIGHYHGIILD